MKKYTILAAVLVLTISMLTGCGCTRRRNDMATTPSNEVTVAPTKPAATQPHVTEPVMPTIDTTEHTGVTGGTEHTEATNHAGGTETVTEPAARSRTAPIH